MDKQGFKLLNPCFLRNSLYSFIFINKYFIIPFLLIKYLVGAL